MEIERLNEWPFEPGDIVEDRSDGDLYLVIERPDGYKYGSSHAIVMVILTGSQANIVCWTDNGSNYRRVEATLQVQS